MAPASSAARSPARPAAGRLRGAWALSLLVVVGGCTRVVGDQPGCEGGGPAGGLAATAPTSLEGRWSVSVLDGVALRNASLRFVATADDIAWVPSCAGQGRTYSLRDGRIAIRIRRVEPSLAGRPPPPVCAIGLPPDLARAFVAMEAATQVRRSGDGGLVLSGGGHELALVPDRSD